MAENLGYEDMKEAAEGFHLKPYGKPEAVRVQLGGFYPEILPMQAADPPYNPTKHLVDKVTGHRGDVDRDELASAIAKASEDGKWQDLPGKFGFKPGMPAKVEVQMALFTEADGSTTIVKHAYFPNGIAPAVFKQLCHGTMHRLIFAHPKIGVKVWQYALSHLKGHHIFTRYLTPEGSRGTSATDNIMRSLTDEQIDAGFDYLKDPKNRPVSTRPFDVLRWTTHALSPGNSDSPIAGWSPPLVKEAIRLLSAEGSLAQPRTKFGLVFPTHYQQWLVDVLEHVWDPEQKAITFLGEPQAGKSPAGRSLLMGCTRHNKRKYDLAGEPSIRVAADIDFLRGQEGHLLMGDMLDDGDCNDQAVKKLKSLLDVNEMEMLVWARWGAVKWKKGQPRAVADNKYAAMVVPEHDRSITHEQFLKAVRPAIDDKASPADVHAILKRTPVSCIRSYVNM